MTDIKSIINEMTTACNALCTPDAAVKPPSSESGPLPPARPAFLNQITALGDGKKKTKRGKRKKGNGGDKATPESVKINTKPESMESMMNKRRLQMNLDENINNDSDGSSSWDGGGGSLDDGVEYGNDPQFNNNEKLKAATRRYARLVKLNNASAVVEDFYESLLDPEQVYIARVQSLQPLLSCKGPLKSMAERGFQLARNDLKLLQQSKSQIESMRPQDLCALFGSL